MSRHAAYGNELNLDEMAAEAGCTPEQLGRAATVALRHLHRVARCDEGSTTAMLLACVCTLGDEAIFHLGGILDEELSLQGEELLMHEVMIRMPFDAEPFRPMMQAWRSQRTPARIQLDEL